MDGGGVGSGRLAVDTGKERETQKPVEKGKLEETGVFSWTVLTSMDKEREH
jgi:hypothetical protein